MKEKLIELLMSAEINAEEQGFFNCHRSKVKAECIADYLLANGVILIPCKVGDTIYVIPSKTNYRLNKLGGFECNNRVYEQKVSEICLYKNNSYLVKTCDGLCSALSEAYNKNWFLTYKEAEKALKERESVE